MINEDTPKFQLAKYVHSPDKRREQSLEARFLVKVISRQTSKPQNVIDSRMVIVGQGVHL